MMTIEKFHENYWSDKAFWLNDHVYYSGRAMERRGSWNDKHDGKFDPHYSMNNFSSKFGKVMTPMEIEKIFHSINYEKYAGKKFILGDYVFYGLKSPDYREEYYKMDYNEFAMYMDYHGYRHKIFTAKKGTAYEGDGVYRSEKDYNKGVEGLEMLIELLKDNPDVELLDYDIKELVGPIGFKKPTSQYGLTPSGYLEKKHPEYKWEGASKKIGEIDLDHFIKMDIVDGIYKPNRFVINKLLDYNNRELLKAKTKKFKDFGVHTIKFLNNSNWDIYNYYDLEGVEVKASKSILSIYPKLRDYSTDEKSKAEILEKEKAEKEAYEKSVYDDTYTLVQLIKKKIVCIL